MKLAEQILDKSKVTNEANMMKACKGLDCDSTDEQIDAAAEKYKMDASAMKKMLKNKKKTDEAVDIQKVIKELISTNWSGSNEDQMKAVQLLKGVATSEDDASNKFMKALDKATSGMKADDFM